MNQMMENLSLIETVNLIDEIVKSKADADALKQALRETYIKNAPRRELARFHEEQDNYRLGYDVGYEEGIKEGLHDGHYDGYEEGFDEGYELGQKDAQLGDRFI